jgi:hypothetical protein
MASYFVACDAQSDGAHAVHDRSLCPPSCFPLGAANEYLGEFRHIAQAVTVARLLYRPVRRCVQAQAPVLPWRPLLQPQAEALIPLRP